MQLTVSLVFGQHGPGKTVIILAVWATEEEIWQLLRIIMGKHAKKSMIVKKTVSQKQSSNHVQVSKSLWEFYADFLSL